jgi:molybdopterin converting factor small subunit
VIRFPEIEIKFLSTFFELAKTDKITLTIPDNSDLDTVLSLIEANLGREITDHIRDHLDYIIIAINNIDSRQLEGLRTKIKKGDRLVIGHVVAGG